MFNYEDKIFKKKSPGNGHCLFSYISIIAYGTMTSFWQDFFSVENFRDAIETP